MNSTLFPGAYTFAIFTVCILSCQSREGGSVIAEDATLRLVSSGFSFTEGPAVDADGNIFFTDQPNDRIMKWSPEGKVSVFMDSAGRSNGLYFDNQGNLLACADDRNQLWSIDKNKKVTVLVSDFEGKKLNGPNDLWVTPHGGIYFTDPFYKRSYWTRTEKEIEHENVYFLDAGRSTLNLAADDFVRPNGIVGTPDGKKLYVADIGAGKTYSFHIQSDGRLTERAIFVEMGSDGMTIDNEGNVYLTGNGVTVFNADGEQIENIPVPESWTANVCFGGEDRQTLFITASGSVYTLKMNVKGVR